MRAMTDSQQDVREAVALIKFKARESYDALGAVLGMSGAAFSARMRGQIEWKVADLDRLADHWGITPVDLLLGPKRASQAYDQRNPESMRYPVVTRQDGISRTADAGLTTRAA